jgi:ATP-dependent DNA helicase RecG
VKALDQTSITQLKGVGSQIATKLARLGLFSVQDVLFHLPTRYVDRTRVTPLGALQPESDVVIEGEVKACDVVFGRRRSLMCKLQDNTGTVTLRFFHFSSAQKNNLSPGTRLRCFGEVRRGAAGLEIYHPEYQFLDKHPAPLEQTLTPVYPTVEGINQTRLRSITQQALSLLKRGTLKELLPDNATRAMPLADALQFIHSPPTDADIHQLADHRHPAQQRLAFEELLAHNLSLLRLRQRIQQQPACTLDGGQSLKKAFLDQLPFALTRAQQKVSQEIEADLKRGYPMLRLVQGDVGSGKTVVAALAVLQAVANGKQAAVMAPTEILAEQHLQNFTAWLAPLDIEIAFLTGKVKGKARDRQLENIASGKAQVVVGTHALFQESVIFNDLALTVIDEQHRFGVHQRLALREKGNGDLTPHQLIMTATPIPRTLAMSAYADLDCSVIDELPPGRSPVNTVLVDQLRRGNVIERISAACSQGRQAYWVCTLIEESETLEAQAAEATADELHLLLPGLTIGLIHGRLKPAEKVRIMDEFKRGDIHLLVATTVIEVGVDVPNASLMIIENPERLGLAQLHQLRGRVGRGSTESHCVLLYSSPLSRQGSERLKTMRQTNDGFKIAEKDLELRGPGEVLGTRQTGEMQLRIADLQRDASLLPEINQLARQLGNQEPDRASAIIDRWLGHNERFAQV